MLCGCYCHRIDIRSNKGPTVFPISDARVNTISTVADIQALYLISRRYSTEVATAQQIGDIMDIIRSSGNRGTEILLGNIPIFQIIMVQQHCLVQDLDGFGIKKIDRLLPISIFYDHWG